MAFQRGRRRLLVVAALVAVLLLAGCAGQKPTDQSSGEEEIKIGVIAPLTGPLAAYGQAFKNGFILAKEEGGPKAENIELIFEDSRYKPKEAVSAYQKLTDVDNVDIVLDWGASTSRAVAPVVEDTPFIAFSFDTSVTKENEQVIRAWNQPKDFAAKILEYGRRRGWEDYGLVKTELTYFNSLVSGFKNQSRPSEDIRVIDAFKFDQRDFKTSIVKIKDQQPDVVGVLLATGQIGQFYRQAREQNMSLPTFGTDFFEDYSLVEEVGSMMEGVVYPNMVVSDEFRDRYTDRFNSQSQITYAGNAYDMFKILADHTDFSSRDTIMNSLKSIKSYQGVLGEYEYREENGDRHFSQPIYIKTVRNKSIVLEKDID